MGGLWLGCWLRCPGAGRSSGGGAPVSWEMSLGVVSGISKGSLLPLSLGWNLTLLQLHDKLEKVFIEVKFTRLKGHCRKGELPRLSLCRPKQSHALPGPWRPEGLRRA